MADHIKKLWEEFSLMVLPPNATTVEMEEFRTVFYTAAAGVFALLMTSDDDTITDDIQEEVTAWAKEKMPGRNPKLPKSH